MARTPAISPEILEAALSGLQAQVARIDEHIAAVRSQLGKRGPGRPPATAVTHASAPAPARKRKKRKLSAEGRANIVAALKKRWAEKKSATATRKAPRKAAKRAARKIVRPPAAE